MSAIDRSIIVAPSILSADFARLGEELRDAGTVRKAVAAGANAVAAGSSIFHARDYAAAIASLREAAAA